MDRRKYYKNNNVHNMLKSVQSKHKDIPIEYLENNMNKRDILHPMNVNDETYRKIQRIKRDHRVFSNNIMFTGVNLLYSLLYSDEIEPMKNNTNK